jgi:hypothetical protein
VCEQFQLRAQQHDAGCRAEPSAMREFVGICLLMVVVQHREIEDQWVNGIGTPLIAKPCHAIALLQF